MLQLLRALEALNVEGQDVGGGVGLPNKLFKNFQIENDKVDGLGRDLLALRDSPERRPHSPPKLLLRKFALLEQIDSNIDNAGDEMVELEQI